MPHCHTPYYWLCCKLFVSLKQCVECHTERFQLHTKQPPQKQQMKQLRSIPDEKIRYLLAIHTNIWTLRNNYNSTEEKRKSTTRIRTRTTKTANGVWSRWLIVKPFFEYVSVFWLFICSALVTRSMTCHLDPFRIWISDEVGKFFSSLIALFVANHSPICTNSFSNDFWFWYYVQFGSVIGKFSCC